MHRVLRRYDPRRSPHWRKVRKQHLALEPSCRACGSVVKLEVHHIHPFHLHPELELSQANLITLCEKPGHCCHFTFGHFHNWRLFNPDVVVDAGQYLAKSLKARKEIQ